MMCSSIPKPVIEVPYRVDRPKVPGTFNVVEVPAPAALDEVKTYPTRETAAKVRQVHERKDPRG